MATPLMAPSSLPISRAFAVPTAWLHVPMATPWATLFLIWNRFASMGEKIAPITPVVMTAAMVIDAVPPSSPVTASAMGAVVDFGSYDPLYTFRLKNGESSSKNNYTMSYAPYNGEEVFTNGFTTVTFATQKRVHLTAVNEKYEDAHIGTLTEAQREAIAKSNSERK